MVLISKIPYWGRRRGEAVVKLTAITDYNRTIGGIGLSDQLTSYNSSACKSVNALEKSFFNAYPLHN